MTLLAEPEASITRGSPPRLTATQDAGTAPTRKPGRGNTADLLSELALTAVSLVSAMGMGRLFTDSASLRPVFWALLLGHGVPMLLHRLRFPWVIAPVLSAIGLAILLPLLTMRDTIRFGLPTTESARVATDALRAAWTQFDQVKAPVAPMLGFTIAAMIGAWLAATFADTLGIRLDLGAEGLVSTAAVVIFVAAFAPERHLMAIGAYVGAATLFGLAHRRIAGRAAPWMSGRSVSWSRKLGPVPLLVGAAVLGAVVLAPQLPGIDGEPIVDWKHGGRTRPAPRTAVSPLVSVRSRLLNQTDSEMFSVGAPAPAYWRLTSLERFDGATWSSNGSYRPTRQSLPGPKTLAASKTTLEQDVRIEGLASIWLPAAYRPTSYNGKVSARFDRDSGSVITDQRSAEGLRYSLQSQLSTLEPDELATADFSDPDDNPGKAGAYRELPSDFSRRVRQLARRITNEASSPYAKARALQDFFRSGEFIYDLTIDLSGAHDVEQFVLSDRRGYCEQFASSYAAMARAIGLNARVAVGFTPGQIRDDGRFHVTGKQAHAWPEVYLGAFGWVAFEPTPGRSIPNGERYTGVGNQADPTTSIAPTTTVAAPAPTTTVAGSRGMAPTTTRPSNAERQRDPAGGTFGGISTQLLALAVIAAAAFVGPITRELRRRRRWADVRDGADEIEFWWRCIEDSVSWIGLAPRHRAETVRASAQRLGEHFDPPLSAQIAAVATQVEAVRFSPNESGAGSPAHDLAPGSAAGAASCGQLVEAVVSSSLRRHVQIRRWLDPRARRRVRHQRPTSGLGRLA